MKNCFDVHDAYLSFEIKVWNWSISVISASFEVQRFQNCLPIDFGIETNQLLFFLSEKNWWHSNSHHQYCWAYFWNFHGTWIRAAHTVKMKVIFFSLELQQLHNKPWYIFKKVKVWIQKKLFLPFPQCAHSKVKKKRSLHRRLLKRENKAHGVFYLSSF